MARRLRTEANIQKTKTVVIRVRVCRTIHSWGGGGGVTVSVGDEKVTQHCRVVDTNTFDMVIGTDILRSNTQVKLFSLQRPYALLLETSP